MSTPESVFIRFQWVLAILHLGSALAFIVLVAVKGDWTVPVVIRFNSWRSLAGGDDVKSLQHMHCFCLATSHIIWRFLLQKGGMQ
jgi:hypothetical protein